MVEELLKHQDLYQGLFIIGIRRACSIRIRLQGHKSKGETH
ncbi:MAG: hypothetical protein QOH93_2269 [Chloroflexia bacterium]|nr:hypothetical protein [Chloroflexia bacterium]